MACFRTRETRFPRIPEAFITGFSGLGPSRLESVFSRTLNSKGLYFSPMAVFTPGRRQRSDQSM